MKNLKANISARTIGLLIGLISTAVLAVAVTRPHLNFSFFVQLLFDDAKEFADTGIITSDFMPSGYAGFLGSCIKIGGTNGIPACQTFIYAGILLTTFLFLRLRGVQNVLLLFPILAIALHPVLLLNVWRIHDGNLTILLLFGFLAAGISSARRGNTWSIIACGISLGLLITVRQNAIPLLVPALLLLWSGNARKNIWRATTLFLVSAFVAMAVVNITTKQTIFSFGRQGPYNFFAGANEYAAPYLLKDYSAEQSLGKALRARGFSSAAESFEGWSSVPSETYTKLALKYIENHPVQYVKLTALKLFTLLRPGYHMTENFTWDSVEGLKRFSKIILAAPFFIWVFFVYKTRDDFFDRELFFVFLAVVLYVLPFLAANADPRYRFPLDIICIADSFCRAKKLSSRKRLLA
ncbi:MAG: hypothetical protein Q8R20_02770 [Nanoarchaeota archaeon]|nr:hypothetical protein [Nanoarchaeota archaeon]